MYENIQNHKKYIGQSTNIMRRKEEHLKWPSPYSKFDNELRKIGEQQFNFIILEQCSADQLDEREQYWINYYDSIKNGYNLTGGGQNYRGEANPAAKLTNQDVQQIIILLEEHQLNNNQIGKLFNVHYNTIDLINRCQTWTHLHNYKKNIRNENLIKDNISAPFLSGETNSNAKITEEQAKHVIHLLESDQRSLAAISRDENISLNILYDINRCKTWKYLHSYKKNIRREYREEGDAINEDK